MIEYPNADMSSFDKAFVTGSHSWLSTIHIHSDGWRCDSELLHDIGSVSNNASYRINGQRPALMKLDFIISIMKQYKLKRQRFYFNHE